MRLIYLFLLSLVLVGCTDDSIVSGYSQDKLDTLLVTKDLSEDGAYGTCKFYIPPKDKILDRLPFVIYFSSEEGDDGVNSIVEYIETEDDPAIVLIVPYGTNALERAAIAQGVENYVKSKLTDLTTAIDPFRIYVTGFGSGGMEAWNFAMENTEWVSTLAPVCSGPPSGKRYKDPEPPITMTEMNIWAVQYVDDPVVNNDYSKKIVTALWTQNLSMTRYTECFEGGHTTAPYKQRAFLDWLFGTRHSGGIIGIGGTNNANEK